MYKIITSSILILCIMLLNSCSFGGSRTEMLNKNDDDKSADARLEEIIKSLKDKDKDAIEAIFSKQAMDDANDFEGNMDKLFGLFKDGIDSWERSDGATVSTSNNHGHKTKEVSSYYYVYSGKQKYFFLLRDKPIDTENPDNVGLYMLLLVSAENEENIWDGDQKILYDGNRKISHAGIYLPLD